MAGWLVAAELSILLAVLAVTTTIVTLGYRNSKPPNILIILADDYGWNDIGYHRSDIKIHTGLQHAVIRTFQQNCLPTDIPTLPAELKKLGYATHIVGKWHLGMYKNECLPTNRGFDSFFGYLQGVEDYYEHLHCTTDACWLDFFENQTPVRNYNGSYSTNLFAKRATEIVSKHAALNPQQPLFMYVPLQAVHTPLQVPEMYSSQHPYIADPTRRVYAGMVSAMDEAVQNIIDAFRNNNLWQDTLMIFSTDNGGPTGSGANNYPLRGQKGGLWEGGIRGIGFVNSPLLPTSVRQTTSRELIHISDWFPTLLELAGGDVNTMKGLDGFNVWNAISNLGKSPRLELLHNIDPLSMPYGAHPVGNEGYDTRIVSAIRQGDWKLLTGDPGLHGHYRVLGDTTPLSPPEQIDITVNNTNIWLFNITDDPNEYYNLAESHPQIVSRLLSKLAYYNSTAVPCRYPVPDLKGIPANPGDPLVPWI